MWDEIQKFLDAIAEDDFLTEAILNQSGIEGKMRTQYNPLVDAFKTYDRGRFEKQSDGSFRLVRKGDKDDYRGKSYAIPPGPGAHEPGTVTAKDEDPVMKSSELSDFLKENFMANLIDNMRPKDIGQAPGVVAGGGRREFPNMMGQYAPWENRKDYMWLGNTV